MLGRDCSRRGFENVDRVFHGWLFTCLSVVSQTIEGPNRLSMSSNQHRFESRKNYVTGRNAFTNLLTA